MSEDAFEFVGEAYSKRGRDAYGDRYHVDVSEYGDVYLRVYEGDVGTEHSLTPKMARKFGKRLRRAADIAESLG